MSRMFRLFIMASAGLSLALAACSRKPEAPVKTSEHGSTDAVAPTNRVGVPAPVRQNLGITFAKVEPRAVARTLRLPARFELLPDARREYRVAIPGRVEPGVAQFQRVEPEDVLYRFRSPRWREMQQQIAEAEGAIHSARAAADTIGPLRRAHKVHEESLAENVSLWTERIAQLETIRQAGGGKADELAQARATLTSARADLAEVIEKDAELEAREREIAAQLQVAIARWELLLASAAAATGLDTAALIETDATNAPRWRTLDTIEVRATMPGVVESISVVPGSWVEETSLVLTTIQPDRVRVHAEGLQSDLGRLREGLPVRVVPPLGGVLGTADELTGSLVMGLAADPERRTLDLYAVPAAVPGWARPGVAAYMEVTTAGGTTELAIPLGAVVRDGLTPIIFKRDSKDPDTAIRMEADLGIDDGRWVVIKSGVKAGDEIVLDGVYQLLLATSGSATKGGHFHSDGTFHEGEDK